MTKLDKLIQELCPDGVKYKELQEILTIKNGSDYKHLSKGDIPVYGSGGIMTYVETFSYDKPSVLIPRKGSIDKLYYVEAPFWNVDTIFYTDIDSTQITPKYLFYCLQREHLEQYNTAGGVPSLTQAVLNKVQIPVPPLPVQREIVRILDNFTELTAELTARKQQYAYYRDKLLTFAAQGETILTDKPNALNRLCQYVSEFIFVKLSDISVNCDSLRKPVTSGNREAGNIPYYGASGIVDYVKDYIFDGDYLLISEDGANLLARNTPIAFSISGKNWVNNHAHILRFNNRITQRYVEIYLNSIDLSPYISGGAQPKLNQQNLYKIPIPLPSYQKQKEIVTILDRFDTLCTDLSSGLPAEIEARQKQYEYYRDKLLSFEEKI